MLHFLMNELIFIPVLLSTESPSTMILLSVGQIPD
jgi:hypothetical protein